MARLVNAVLKGPLSVKATVAEINANYSFVSVLSVVSITNLLSRLNQHSSTSYTLLVFIHAC